jgi:hypothetical protein
MEALKELMTKRDELEEELNLVNIQLEPLVAASKFHHLNTKKLTILDYDKSYVDSEGFPRADLDFTKI